MNNFLQRTITGTIFVAVLVGAILLGGTYLYLLLAVILGFSLWEFYQLFAATKFSPNRILGVSFGVITFLLPWIFQFIIYDSESAFASFRYEIPIYIILLFTLFGIIAVTEVFRNKDNAPVNVGLTIAGILYLTLPMVLASHMADPHQLDMLMGSRRNEFLLSPLLLIFIVIWTNDTFAYLTGKWLGKHKLYESVSPGKTWEGFLGGLIFSILAAVIVHFIIDSEMLWVLIANAIVISVLGTAGDLFQSKIKRSVGVKDSGKILPGHGGILDRIDGFLIAIPFVFAFNMLLFMFGEL